jgi:hypothetical protein
VAAYRLRVRIRPSRLRFRITCALIAILTAGAVALAGANQFWVLPLLLTLLSGLLFSLYQAQPDDTLLMTEMGDGVWASDQTRCQLLADSLLTPQLLALHLLPQTQSNPQAPVWQLVFADQVSARGWRRLRRIALNLRH